MNWIQRMHSLRAPWMAAWLVVALVIAPALGRMHEVLHAPVTSAAHAQTSSHTHSDTLDVSAWFAGHEALDCLVLDQLAHGLDGPPPAVAALYSLPQFCSMAYKAWHLLPATMPVFLARAPPARFMA